ncbi:MAG: PilN domain-containing protein [Candidatus Krumholzibacteria bacterium]|nr:PilN domain-containing protein [Candidatus Krumholzibacteria bacterium]
MIRINLLPVAERKQRRSLKLPSFSGGGPKIVWALVAVVIYVGMVLATVMLQTRSIRTLEHKVAEAKREAAELAPQLERIRQLTEEREEVNKRLSVIAALDRDRYFRVGLLNDISTQLPANCWLTAVKELGGTIMTVEGVTFSNYIIADLMNNLEKTDHFTQVDLNIAQEGSILDHRVIQFTLQSQVSPAGQVAVVTTEKGLP